MKNRRVFICAALIIMVVGLATVTSVLYITGNLKIASNNDEFDIYFSSAILDGVDKTNLLVTDDKKHITFETRDLRTTGESSILDFEVTNNSTQYDAHVNISCITDSSEYISLSKDRDEYDIPAQTRDTGKLTITLLKTSTSFIDQTITCTIDARAEERNDRKEKVLVDPEYQITGTLIDSDGNPLEDKNLVVFSDTPHYVSTDNFGFFYATGLEKGEHEIYYVGNNVDLESKSKEDIKDLALDKAIVTTSDSTINFDEIELDDFIVEPVKTGKVELSFDTDGGTQTDNKKVDLYTKAKDLPIPTKKGNVFKGWYYNGRKINDNTIINNDKDLRALWDKDNYNISFVGMNFNASQNNIVIEYGQNASVSITPSTGYFLESMTCDGGYTNNAKTGTAMTGTQNILVSSNDNPNGSICTVAMKPLKITVTFDGNGGTPSISSKTYSYKNTLGTLPTGTRTNYKLVGWYTLPNGGNEVSADTIVDYESNITFYAHWEEVTILTGKTISSNSPKVGKTSTNCWDSEKFRLEDNNSIDFTYYVSGQASAYCGPYTSASCSSYINYASKGTATVELKNSAGTTIKTISGNYNRSVVYLYGSSFNLSDVSNGEYYLHFCYTQSPVKIGGSDCCGSDSSGSPSVVGKISDISF